MSQSENPKLSPQISIDDFLRKLTLPIRYFGGEFVIAEKYKEEERAFFDNYIRLNGSEFPKSKQQKVMAALSDIRHSIEQNFKLISEIFSYHESADLKDAQIAFDTL